MLRLLKFGSALLVLSFATTAYAQKTITVNFDSVDKFKESNGAEGVAQKSTMTKEQRAAAIAVAQKEYDDALGKGKVTVKEGTGGDVDITVTAGQAIKKGAKYGNAGQEGKTGIVYQGEFGLKDEELSNGVGHIIAHEAGHKLGIGEHNDDKPATKMTRSFSDSDLKAKDMAFDAHDIKKMKKTLGLASAEQKGDTKLHDLGVFVGEAVVLGGDKLTDDYLDSILTFSGPVGAEFGYINSGGDFVWQGDTDDNPYPDFLTFIYSAGANLAVHYGGQLFTLENGAGHFVLSDLNPFNTNVYRHAELTFETSGGTAFMTLDTSDLGGTGGFHAVPEPAAWVIMLAGFGLAGAVLRTRRRQALALR